MVSGLAIFFHLQMTMTLACICFSNKESYYITEQEVQKQVKP